MAARKVFGSLAGFSIPLRLEKAVDDDDPNVHTVCVGEEGKPHDPVRVKQTVACPVCEKTASSHYGFPERGAENAQGEMVVIDQEAIAEAKGKPITGKIDCPFAFRFHYREKLFAGTMYFGNVQNLLPAPGGEEPYAYLHHYLSTHPDRVAAFTWAPRTKNTHWVVEAAEGGRLIAYALAFPEAVRTVAGVPPMQLDDTRIAMFEQAAEIETVDFNPDDYRNEAKAGVQALIDAATGVPMPTGTGAPVAGGGDMFAALRASVAAAKPVKKVAAKKAPAKKVAAKKPAAKKTAKKAPAKRALKKTA